MKKIMIMLVLVVVGISLFANEEVDSLYVKVESIIREQGFINIEGGMEYNTPDSLFTLFLVTQNEKSLIMVIQSGGVIRLIDYGMDGMTTSNKSEGFDFLDLVAVSIPHRDYYIAVQAVEITAEDYQAVHDKTGSTQFSLFWPTMLIEADGEMKMGAYMFPDSPDGGVVSVLEEVLASAE